MTSIAQFMPCEKQEVRYNLVEKRMAFDVVIVGSGPAGVHSAYPLVEAGLRVAVIDGGLDSKRQDGESMDSTRSAVKSNALGLLMKGSYAFNKTYQLLKIKSNIDVIQTLAKGGLSEFWHGICDYLTSEELVEMGLPANEIQKEYKEATARINLNLKPRLDLHGKLILENARNQVYRLPVAYSYRTSSIVEDLKRRKNFTYIPGQLVFKVRDKTRYVEIESLSIEKLIKSSVRARYLILAAGSVNTTRILLRSFDLFDYKTTFLTKSHYMVVCLHPRTLINNKETKIINPGQVAFASNAADQRLGAFVQVYKCNPLMFDNTLAYIPLPKPVASLFLSLFIHSLVIADVRFPAFETQEKYCRLKKGEGQNGDILEIFFHQTKSELRNYKIELKKVSQTLKSFGLFPLKTVSDPVTSHYGGGVPFHNEPRKLSADINSKLHQAKRIYIADSSTWRALPAKPLALTIMVNASRVGKIVLRKFNTENNL